MSVTLVCTLIVTVAMVTMLSGFRPYGIMTDDDDDDLQLYSPGWTFASLTTALHH
jgi:hypothetical protein